ncbi:MAG: Crp/Fnr family transcriptional regulator [Hyphomicrobiales bacterium]|jgi:CRP/FNR family transcriptional regulator, anaerobic regulatory protein|nr:Crp/Fnr family transcriptional regulator [Hyphomicrobiales bacterium]MBV9906207.1 Crp/Fnr family transcriptional regulator [Hyphomicrobiales bacterium]
MIEPAVADRALKRYPMLNDLPAAERESAFRAASLMKVPVGAALFDEGEPCRGFALLLSGTVRVSKVAPNGRELHLYDVAPGDSCVLTCACLLGQSTYNARAVAREDLEIIVLPAAAFRDLCSRLEPFREQVFARFSTRMTEMMELIAAVAFQKLDQRLASSLIAKPSPIRTTHQALADELGSIREIVSRLLKNFADHGWIRLGREQIEVLNSGSLKQLASGAV